MMKQKLIFSLIGILGLPLVGCQPTVQLQAPDKPIQVNMNVDVKMQVEKDVQSAVKNNPDIF